MLQLLILLYFRKAPVIMVKINSFSDRLQHLQKGKLVKFLVSLKIRSHLPWSKSDLHLLLRSKFFVAGWYLAKYPDVSKTGLNPLEHYLLSGAGEGLDPGPEFSTIGYWERYPDVAATGMNPLLHYLRYGQKEGRNPMPLGGVIDQLTEYSKMVRKSELFDSHWYLSQYPSVEMEGVDPVLDYLRDGYRQGRNPSPEFDTNFYLTEYQDIFHSGQNPLVHYLLYGLDEGRLPKAGKAYSLERKLWGGFSRYALKELEAIKHTVSSRDSEKVSAAWSLLVWYASQGEYSQAIENFDFACCQRASLRSFKKWAIPAACCQIQLRDFNSARKLLATILDESGFNPDSCLAMANIAPFQAAPAGFKDSDSFRLHWINRVFENVGLAPILKRDTGRDLAVDNLSAKVQLRPTTFRQERISIIMPIFNAASTLTLAIESILCQTWQNIELIIVDDLSTDGSLKIAQQFATQDPRVTVVEQTQNRGAYSARNAGVRLSTGDFITVHDCDDWSHPQKLEKQMAPLLNNSRLFGSFSYWVKVDWDMNIVGGWRPWGNLIEFNHSSFLFRRSLIASIGEWDNVRVAGDTEFIWRAETKHGKEAFTKVYESVPLSFSMACEKTLTQSKYTHVKTVFFGLRRMYREASHWWHNKEKENLYLHNDEFGIFRPFPAPHTILGVSFSGSVTHVLISDFSRTALAADGRSVDILEAVSCKGKVALFHWPNYGVNTDDPLDDRIFEIAAKNNVRLLVPGETVTALAAVIVLSKSLRWLPDSLPTFNCQSVLSIDDIFDESDTDVNLGNDIQLNIESIFGITPVGWSFAGFLSNLPEDNPDHSLKSRN